MAKARRGWIVTKHGPLQKLDDNLWAVEGRTPGVPIQRRMVIARKGDGALVFFHAIPLDDKTLEEVRSLGKPAYLVLGHHQHAIDAHAFQQKLELQTYGPKACEAELRKRVELSGTLETFPSDPSISVESVPGTKLGEAVMTVRSGDRSSLMFSDVIQNNPKESTPLVFRMMGFGGGPKVVWVFQKMFINDRAAVKSWLEKWAALPGLHRLVPFHGMIVADGAAKALGTAAGSI
jgi:hypothetical protein